MPVMLQVVGRLASVRWCFTVLCCKKFCFRALRFCWPDRSAPPPPPPGAQLAALAAQPVSRQPSAVSRQPSAVSRQPSAPSPWAVLGSAHGMQPPSASWAVMGGTHATRCHGYVVVAPGNGRRCSVGSGAVVGQFWHYPATRCAAQHISVLLHQHHLSFNFNSIDYPNVPPRGKSTPPKQPSRSPKLHPCPCPKRPSTTQKSPKCAC